MPAKSRYMRTIDASKHIAKAAGIIGTIDPKSPPETRAITLASAIAQVRVAAQTIEAVVEECSLARGMYLNNSTIRNAIISAGEYLNNLQPRIAQVQESLESAKSSDFDSPAIQSALTSLAVDIATVSFNSTAPTL